MKKISDILRAPISRLISGTLVANIINALGTALITFIFSPDVYATFGLFSMFISLGNAMVTLKLGVLYMNENNLKSQARNFKSLLLILPSMSLLIGIVFFVFIKQKWFGFGIVPQYYSFLLTITLLAIGSYNYLKLVSLKAQSYRKLQVLEPIRSITRSFVQILLGILEFKYTALPLGEAVGRYAGISSLVKGQYFKLKEYQHSSSLTEGFRYIKKNYRFMALTSLSSIINVIGTTIMLPVMIYLYGESLAGEYSFVMKLLSIPIVLIGSAAADVFHEQCSNQTENIPKLFLKYSKNLALLAISIFTLLFFLINPLTDYLLNENWIHVSTIVQILIPWFFGILVVSPLSRVLLVVKMEHLKFIYDFFGLSGMLILMWFASETDLEWQKYLLYASLYWFLAYIVYYSLIVFSIKKFKKQRI